MLRALAYLLVMLGSAGLDQATKIWARSTLTPGEVIPVIPQVLDLTLTQNYGVAFGTLGDLHPAVRQPLMLVVPVAVSLFVLVLAVRNWRHAPELLRVGFLLILGGAAGNIIDRIAFGSVTDFMRFRLGESTLFVNNLADDFVSLGVLFWLMASWRREEPTPAATS